MKFKTNNLRNQRTIFGYAVNDFIDDNHLARMVDAIFDAIDVSYIEIKYSEHGRPAYHPRTMLKIWFYAYMNKVRSSRELARLLEENVAYFFLSNLERPRFRILCYFRKNFAEEMEKIFAEVVAVLHKMGLVNYEKIFIDGTIMQANASKRRTKTKNKLKDEIKKLEEKVQEHLASYFQEVEAQDEADDRVYGERRGDELPSHIAEEIKKGNLKKLVNNTLEKLPREEAEELKRDVVELEKRYKAMEEMEQQGEKETNLTDKDARLMKRPGKETKAGYNTQIATENQFIIGNNVSQDKDDSHQLRPTLEKVEETRGKSLKEGANVTTDARYYNHDNLEYLDDKKLRGVIPDLQKKKNDKNKFSKDKFTYIEEEDVFVCPEGKKLHFERTGRDSRSGREVKIYRTKECKRCKYWGKCTTDKRGRSVKEDGTLLIVQEMKERVESEEGKERLSERKTDVEPVIGNIKQNMGHRGFSLRGIAAVRGEWTMICIAHNLKKLWLFLQELARQFRIGISNILMLLLVKKWEPALVLKRCLLAIICFFSILLVYKCTF
ncbi:MAG: IS1182 family transposase [Candidatus Hydrothermarchaeota archaeon]